MRLCHDQRLKMFDVECKNKYKHFKESHDFTGESAVEGGLRQGISKPKKEQRLHPLADDHIAPYCRQSMVKAGHLHTRSGTVPGRGLLPSVELCNTSATVCRPQVMAIVVSIIWSAGS